MTPAPEADSAAPRDPADYRPRPVMGLSVWVLLVFGLVCVLAGIGVAILAPRLWAQRPAARHAEAAPSVPEPASAATVAPPPEAAPAPPATIPDLVQTPQLDRLASRVSALEAEEGRTGRAAAAALAAAAVVEASQGSRPFPDEVAALKAAAPGAPEVAGLTRLAQTGAPSRASLAASFPDYAARAASAARRPGEGGSLSDRIVYALSQVVMMRRVGDVAGDGPDALIARAERALEDGDFERCFAALDKLPPAARDAFSPWRVRAERRAEIDRDTAALRARALADLAAAGRGGT